MMGKTYMAMKDHPNALLWLTKAKDYPPHTVEDKEVHALSLWPKPNVHGL